MRIFIALALASIFIGLSAPTNAAPQPAALKWEAVKAQIPTGDNVRLDIRLVGADEKPVTSKITVTSTRFDMGPDKMATMTAPVRPVASSQPGVVGFQADVSSAGHWALTVSANVAGQAQPVTGSVVFTAAKP